MLKNEMPQEIVIKAGGGLKHYWKDIWQYRELFYFLAWRDILVRYKQTAIGIAWSVIRPLITIVIFTIIFGNVAHLPSNGIPYPLLVFVAMLPWQFFSNSLGEASNSLVANSSMLSKIYFPRLIVPTSTVIVSITDFLISLVMLLILMAWYRIVPSWHFITLPFFFLVALITSIGGGLWLGALTVVYRDFRYVVPFIIQLGLYVSPVGFDSSLVPEKWRVLYSLNPMVGVIDGFRWAILGQSVSIFWPGFVASILISLLLLISGFIYFRHMERSFADII